MQITKRSFSALQGFQFSLLTLCGFFIATSFGPIFASTNKAKVDQPRPQTKTSAKGLASRPTPRAAEGERKGKKGAALPQQSVHLGKKVVKAAPVAATRAPREQHAKLKTPPRSQQAINKPVPVKTTAKLTSKTSTSGRLPRLTEQPLTSRLTRASFTPTSSLKPQIESESGRRGKFGKHEADELPNTDRRVERDGKTPASIQPIRRTETAKSRNPERIAEREETLPATRPREISTADETPGHQIQLPDKIEVVEYGSTSPTISKLLTLPDSRPLTPFGAIVTKTNTPPTRRNDLAIPQQRVLEIQYELVKRGFYSAEPNGLYDEATILAMWEFQKNYGLPATGYPSAHSLKRLGLTGW